MVRSMPSFAVAAPHLDVKHFRSPWAHISQSLERVKRAEMLAKACRFDPCRCIGGVAARGTAAKAVATASGTAPISEFNR